MFQCLNLAESDERRLTELIIFYFTDATDKIKYADMREALLLHGETGEQLMQTIAQELQQIGLQR